MRESIAKVAEFHRVTGSPILDSPKIPDNRRIELRVDLLREELKEFEEAAYKGDIVGVLDAFMDLQYVLNGAMLEFGLAGVAEDAFAEVHNSNMSKFTKTTYDAQESCKRYQFKDIEAYYRKVGDLHVILRSADDKILKGMHFYEPRLKLILERFRRSLKAKPVTQETVSAEPMND